MKPIISVDYGEMHKFASFVNLYSTELELVRIILKLRSGEIEMYSTEEAKKFLSNHKWSIRGKQIASVLKDVGL